MYIVGYGVGGFVFDLDPKADTEMDWLVSEQKKYFHEAQRQTCNKLGAG